MKRKKASGALIVASVLVGLAVFLSHLNGPGIHPTAMGHYTTCEEQVPNAIKQSAHAAFNRLHITSIAEVVTLSDNQKAYYAGTYTTRDQAGDATVLACHGIATMKNGTTHPLKWQVEFRDDHSKSDLGVEEVSH